MHLVVGAWFSKSQGSRLADMRSTHACHPANKPHQWYTAPRFAKKARFRVERVQLVTADQAADKAREAAEEVGLCMN